MTPSPLNDHLTQQQLADFLDGKLDAAARGKVEQLLNDCELSREAVAGFSAMPGALGDLGALNKQIAAKSGMGASSSAWMNVFIGVAAVAVIGAVTYFAWPSDQPQISQITQIDSADVSPKVVTNELPPFTVVALTPQSEHFVNPESKGEVKKPMAEKTDSVATQPQLQPEPIDLPEPQLLESKPVIPAHPEAGYNASIGFVLDLKVTEYDIYYKGTIEVRELKLGGVPAEFEDEGGRDRAKKEKEVVKQVPADQFLAEGLQAFRDGRYGRCIEKMEVLKKNNPHDLNAVFYMGVSYVKLEMYGKAIPLFDEILNSSNNVFHEEARWYKAQALLGKGDTEAAKQLLSEIVAKEGFYQAKAKALLK